MSTVTPLTTVAPVEVSQGMLDLADRLEEAAKLIREGKVRSGALVYVEYGPDMNVTSDWCSSLGGTDPDRRTDPSYSRYSRRLERRRLRGLLPGTR